MDESILRCRAESKACDRYCAAALAFDCVADVREYSKDWYLSLSFVILRYWLDGIPRFLGVDFGPRLKGNVGIELPPLP